MRILSRPPCLARRPNFHLSVSAYSTSSSSSFSPFNFSKRFHFYNPPRSSVKETKKQQRTFQTNAPPPQSSIRRLLSLNNNPKDDDSVGGRVDGDDQNATGIKWTSIAGLLLVGVNVLETQFSSFMEGHGYAFFVAVYAGLEDYCHPVNLVEAAIIIPCVVYSPNYATTFSSTRIKYPPNCSYKPLPLRATSPISIPPFQALNGDSGESLTNDSSDDGDLQQIDPDADEIVVEIEKISKNRRRIRSKVAVDASLETIWGILTDYERLADFIPGLAVSQVLDKRENFARLLQIGEQKLAFGLVFNAKGVIDCYEKDFESFPYGKRRDIEFKMIEGDFSLFEGKWAVEQLIDEEQRYNTTLTYAVDVEPKMWLPVQLVEGRLSRDIKSNLFSIRDVAQKASDNISSL